MPTPTALFDGFERVVQILNAIATERPLPTVEVPWFRDGLSPGSFEYGADVEVAWPLAVGIAYHSNQNDPAMQAAVAEVSGLLPAAVREATYPLSQLELPAAASAFCGFCELVLDQIHDGLPIAESEADDAVEAAAEALVSFCDAERHRLVHVVPLEGVRLATAEVSIAPNVSLRTVDKARQQEIWRRIGTAGFGASLRMSPDIHEVAAVEAQIEVTVDLTPGEVEFPGFQLQAPVELIIDSLRLLGSGPVRYLGQWTEPPEHARFLARLFPSGTHTPAQRPFHRSGEHVLVDDALPLAQTYDWMLDTAKWSAEELQTYEVAHRRFSQTYDRQSDEDRLIDAWIAFEALFLPKQEGELSYRAQMRIARFVGADLNERETLLEQLRNSYSMRSKVVHGAPAAKRKPEQVEARASETLEILRRALRSWICPTTDRSSEALDRALLS